MKNTSNIAECTIGLKKKKFLLSNISYRNELSQFSSENFGFSGKGVELSASYKLMGTNKIYSNFDLSVQVPQFCRTINQSENRRPHKRRDSRVETHCCIEK